MKHSRFVIALLLLASCASNPSRSPGSSDGKSGFQGQGGKSGKSGGVNHEYWYEHSDLAAHYHFAIIAGDREKMREWMEAGYSANFRASPRHATAIEQALGYGNSEIVKMLLENPNISARPDPRKKLFPCHGMESGPGIGISQYDFIVYQDAVRDYESSCTPKDYYTAKSKDDANLYVRESDFELFTLLAERDQDPASFAADTSGILASLKKSAYSRESTSANSKLIQYIEAKTGRSADGTALRP